MRSALVPLFLWTSMAFPLVTGYHIGPVKAALSGWTGSEFPNNSVSEIVTCCWDELDSASGGYVELFQGDTIGSSPYLLGIYEQPGGVKVAGNPGRPQGKPSSWLKFEVYMEPGMSFTKGKRYEFRFTRSGSDSLEYYYQTGDPYRFGLLFDPNLNPVPVTWDLCMRLYARTDPVTPEWWSIVPGCPYDSSGWLGTWRERMETLGVKRADFSIYWDAIESSQGNFNFTALGHDTRAHQLDSLLECVLDARPQLCPKWASSRVESIWVGDTTGNDSLYGYWRYDTCVHCPPRNLSLPVDSNSNYWARFIERTARHYDSVGNPIHVWTGYNEPNDTLNIGDPPTTGWWRRPNVPGVYEGLGPGARGLCSLYVQLCLVAESVIHHCSLTGHASDKFLIGSTAGVRRAWEGDTIIVPGDSWIWMCYDIATGPNGPGIFWDGVAVHPYQYGWQDLVETYEGDARRVHEIMREFEHNGEVWNQELGWPYSEGAEKQARNLAEAFVVTKASEVLPEGGFDGMMWYTLLGTPAGAVDHHQILDSGPAMTPRPAFHAFAQLTQALTGKRYNGRVMTGRCAGRHSPACIRIRGQRGQADVGRVAEPERPEYGCLAAGLVRHAGHRGAGLQRNPARRR